MNNVWPHVDESFRKMKVVSIRNRLKMILLIALVLFWTGIAFSRYTTNPVHPGVPPTTVNLPKGSGFLRITDILHDTGLVENRPFFWMLALVKKAIPHIQAGEYELNGAMSPNEILNKLVRGEIKVYKVVLPENLTANEAAKRLLADKLIDEKEFMALSVDRSFLSSLSIEADSIEGYLYPDTYHFNRSMTTEKIIRTILEKFWKEVTPELREKAKEMGLTMNEWVTLASMIGKESGIRAEKPLIAAVFHNRLRMGMKLQSDPTAIYHLAKNGQPVPSVRKEHLQSDTPYNTYIINGLPAGPIASPGIDSLVAALYPASVDYLYFVANNDGGHHFSKNLSAHNQAVLKYQIHNQKK